MGSDRGENYNLSRGQEINHKTEMKEYEEVYVDLHTGPES